jgi:hypothetical protein
VCSTDDYFTDSNGEYHYVPENSKEAHAACLRKYVEALQNPFIAVIVVDNTNISVAEIAPYYALAEAYGVAVDLITIDCSPTSAHARNVHDVPLNTVVRMSMEMICEEARFPTWWEHSHVTAPGELEQVREEWALEEMARIRAEHPIMGQEEKDLLEEWAGIIQ